MPTKFTTSASIVSAFESLDWEG